MSNGLLDVLASVVSRLAPQLGIVVGVAVGAEPHHASRRSSAGSVVENGLGSLMMHVRDSRLHYPHIITLVDYRINADRNRLWTINLRTKQVLIETLVAHGSGTGRRQNHRDQVQFVGNDSGSELSSSRRVRHRGDDLPDDCGTARTRTAAHRSPDSRA